MLDSFLRLFNDSPSGLRGKIAAIYSLLVAFNVAAWIWAFVAFRDQPVLLGTALLVPPATGPRSTTTTRRPSRAAKYAHAAPTAPAPITTRSAVRGRVALIAPLSAAAPRVPGLSR